ncbi:MAG: integration host factor subunit beta [Proteobacteria bacterium]|nr:integration host factor subunit beta [Pseudomonadota bacterium]
MTKSELISKLQMQYKRLPGEVVEKCVDVILEGIASALDDHRRVEVRGFGNFSIREWQPRFARNPETGETWRTPPVNAVYFRPGKELKMRVNGRGYAESKFNNHTSEHSDHSEHIECREE